MFNLILKDLKSSYRALLMIFSWWVFLIYFCGALFPPKGYVFPFIVISLALVFQPMNADDKNKTEKLYVSLPLKRSTIVSARYMWAFSTTCILLFITYFAGTYFHKIMPEVFKNVASFKMLMASQLWVFYNAALVYPLFFKYGVYLEAGMTTCTFLILGIMLFNLLIILIVLFFNVNPFEIKHILVYCTLFTLLLTTLSWLLSKRIYGKREF